MKVAVILNTDCHVETLLFICLALERIPQIEPVAFPLKEDRRGLRALLERTRTHYSFIAQDLEAEFDVSVVVSAYPSGINIPAIPSGKHPFITSMSDRQILITHRANAPLSRYAVPNVICLSPAGAEQGIPHLYPCEHPLLGHVEIPRGPSIRLLVQGNFDQGHRELKMIREILGHFQTGIHIVLLGKGASGCGFDSNDERVAILDGLDEIGFYEAAASCDYVLPLVSKETRGGSYIGARFSSSLGISFADLKPAIVHESLQAVYPFNLGYSYKDAAGLFEILSSLIRSADVAASDRAVMVKNREIMRRHNEQVLSAALLAATAGP